MVIKNDGVKVYLVYSYTINREINIYIDYCYIDNFATDNFNWVIKSIEIDVNKSPYFDYDITANPVIIYMSLYDSTSPGDYYIYSVNTSTLDKTKIISGNPSSEMSYIAYNQISNILVYTTANNKNPDNIYNWQTFAYDLNTNTKKQDNIQTSQFIGLIKSEISTDRLYLSGNSKIDTISLYNITSLIPNDSKAYIYNFDLITLAEYVISSSSSYQYLAVAHCNYNIGLGFLYYYKTAQTTAYKILNNSDTYKEGTNCMKFLYVIDFLCKISPSDESVSPCFYIFWISNDMGDNYKLRYSFGYINNIAEITIYPSADDVDKFIIGDCLNIGPTAFNNITNNDIYISYIGIYGYISYAKISDIIKTETNTLNENPTHSILNKNGTNINLTLNWQLSK